METQADIDSLLNSPWECMLAQAHADDFELVIDESDFIPEFLPEEVSMQIDNLMARPSTDGSGWTLLEDAR